MQSNTLSDSVQPLSFQVLNTTHGQFCNEEIVARLIHFWEARNFAKGNILMGIELLLIDSESNAVQGFISANRLHSFQKKLKTGSVYKLRKIMIKPCKTLYKVSGYPKTIFFTDHTNMVEVTEGQGDYDLPSQKFRLSTFNTFAAIADTNTDLFDVIGQLRLISGDNLHTPTTLEKGPVLGGDRSSDRVFLHLLMKDGETIRVYLWGNIAAKFRERWNRSEAQPVVLLITTVNSKTLGGAISLSSTSSTRLFFDTDVEETKEFMTWLGEEKKNLPAVTSSSAAVTKLETVTLKDINQYLQSENPQVASFYCFATIVDVLDQRGWYYISCKCNTKLGKTETSLYCTSCNKTSNMGLLRYRFEILVRDTNDDEATFVLFDQDGRKLTGRNVADAFKDPKQVPANEEAEGNEIQFPQYLREIIGRTCKFQIKISEFNLTVSRQSFTVSRIIDPNLALQNMESKDVVQQVNNCANSKTTGCDPPTNTEEHSSELVEINDKKSGKRPRHEI